MPSSRATIAAGTKPPRVMQTIASNGPAPLSRQASARESRWNWSHETGKIFAGSRVAEFAGFAGVELCHRAQLPAGRLLASSAFTRTSIASTAALAAASFCASRERTTTLVLPQRPSSMNG